MEDARTQISTYYKSLTMNMVLIIILVSVAPLLLISGTIRYYFQASYQEKVRDHLRVLIKKHTQNIDTFLTEKLADIRTLARSFPIDEFRDERFLEKRLNMLQEEYGRAFVDLGLIDENGIQIAYAGPFKLKEADYSNAQWFVDAQKGADYISDVFPGLRGIPHFIVAVRQEYQGRKWLVRATVDFESFNSLVENIRIGSTGFAFILSKKGEFQTKPRMGAIPFMEPYLHFLKTETSHEVNVVETTDRSGTELVDVMCRFKKGEWLLAYQQNADEAYAALYEARRFTALVFLIGLAAIVVAAILVSRRMVKRIHEADSQKEMMNERVIEAGKLASLGELAAGIAHEINNPVAVMVEEAGWMQDLLQEEELKQSENVDEFKRSLDQIRSQGNRCKQITHKLLSFARKTDPRHKPIQINEVITEVMELCQQRARYATAKITCTLDPDLPTVMASPTEMQQVFMNLVNNSLDAIDSAGGNIEITSSRVDNYVVIDVADNGPGIPEANLARIFDPFFTTKPVGKGTGLGLSICYGIITKMDGKISVNSAVGRGTTFHIQIPIPKTENTQ